MSIFSSNNETVSYWGINGWNESPLYQTVLTRRNSLHTYGCDYISYDLVLLKCCMYRVSENVCTRFTHFYCGDKQSQKGTVSTTTVELSKFYSWSLLYWVHMTGRNVPCKMDRKRWARCVACKITGFNVQGFIHRITVFFWTFLSSGILETRKHDVSETGSVCVLRWKRGEDTYSVGPVRKRPN
jgi:hypothetical protein